MSSERGATEERAEERTEESTDGSAGRAAPSRLAELIELLRGALDDLRTLRVEALSLARIRADRARLGLFKAAFLAALGLLLGIAAVGALSTAGVLIVLGLAGGLTQLLGISAWLGALSTGIALLLLCALAVFIARRIALRRFGRELESRYSARESDPR